MDTEEAAKRLAEMIMADPGRIWILGLTGPLGAGKTTLTQNLAGFLGVRGAVVSPTYVLHIQHSFQFSGFSFQLEHIDAYRLESWEELERLGLRKMIENKSVIVIEWGDKFTTELIELTREQASQARLVWVKIEYSDKENERNVVISN